MHTILKTFTLLVFSSFLLVSCTIDDDTAPVINAENLMGEWELVSMDMDMSVSAEYAGFAVDLDMSAEVSAPEYTVTFGEDSWSTVGGYTYDYSLVIPTQEPISNSATIADASGSGNYSLDGSIITLSGSFFEFEIEGYANTAVSEGQVAQLSFDDEGQLVMTQSIAENTDMGSDVVANGGSTISVWKRK